MSDDKKIGTFAELLETHKEEWSIASAGRNIIQSSYTAEPVKKFFTKNHFDHLEFINNGCGSILLKDVDNPSIVFRIGPSYDVRAVVPQIIQPIYSKKIENVRIEILPNISPDHLSDEEITLGVEKYRKEAATAGYRLHSDNLAWDVGAFRFEDPKKPGQIRTVIMGTDAGLIENAVSPPTCTSDYPTLEIQWREQCKLVEADARLKHLLKGLPKKLPVTRVIPSPAANLGM